MFQEKPSFQAQYERKPHLLKPILIHSSMELGVQPKHVLRPKYLQSQTHLNEKHLLSKTQKNSTTMKNI